VPEAYTDPKGGVGSSLIASLPGWSLSGAALVGCIPRFHLGTSYELLEMGMILVLIGGAIISFGDGFEAIA
jgi:hypothetical protein